MHHEYLNFEIPTLQATQRCAATRTDTQGRWEYTWTEKQDAQVICQVAAYRLCTEFNPTTPVFQL